MFKFIGAVAGYYLFGFFGVLLGLFVGSVLDRLRDYGSGGINPLQNALRQTVFLETMFISMGRLAKADGRVSPEEIAHAEEMMRQLGMTAEHRAQAIELFKRGSAPEFDIGPVYTRFMSVCGHTRHLRQMLLVYLITMALADGHMHAAEEALLADIAGRLGYSPSEFRHLMEMVLNQSHFMGGKPSPETALEDAYKALGVTKENTDQEIKRAYRKLISQYHPDKLIGQGMPADMIAMATEKTKEIQLAHDVIKRTRNI
ncbi:MAG: co-chaperone DjlA [Gammaproteobacteria bacterium]|nr:co-chaperone DjlA [Gammaproteobacteria bacterium]MBU1414465.1 co-chaperone DjlA [Gammaproteobacteria bacterium]